MEDLSALKSPRFNLAKELSQSPPSEFEFESMAAEFIRIARKQLQALGLGAHIPLPLDSPTDNLHVCRLARMVFQFMQVDQPADEEIVSWLYIDTINSVPDEFGWSYQIKLDLPYWFPKAEIDKLGELQHFLTSLQRSGDSKNSM